MRNWLTRITRALADRRRARIPAQLLHQPAPDLLQLYYAPRSNGVADPGEVVWTWVPYGSGRRQGKDRPVLVVGRDGPTLLALSAADRQLSRHDPG